MCEYFARLTRSISVRESSTTHQLLVCASPTVADRVPLPPPPPAAAVSRPTTVVSFPEQPDEASCSQFDAPCKRRYTSVAREAALPANIPREVACVTEAWMSASLTTAIGALFVLLLPNTVAKNPPLLSGSGGCRSLATHRAKGSQSRNQTVRLWRTQIPPWRDMTRGR